MFFHLLVVGMIHEEWDVPLNAGNQSGQKLKVLKKTRTKCFSGTEKSLTPTNNTFHQAINVWPTWFQRGEKCTIISQASHRWLLRVWHRAGWHGVPHQGDLWLFH